MTNTTLARLVVAALTVTIVVVLVMTSRRDSNPCAWNAAHATPSYVCAVLAGE